MVCCVALFWGAIRPPLHMVGLSQPPAASLPRAASRDCAFHHEPFSAVPGLSIAPHEHWTRDGAHRLQGSTSAGFQRFKKCLRMTSAGPSQASARPPLRRDSAEPPQVLRSASAGAPKGLCSAGATQGLHRASAAPPQGLRRAFAAPPQAFAGASPASPPPPPNTPKTKHFAGDLPKRKENERKERKKRKKRNKRKKITMVSVLAFLIVCQAANCGYNRTPSREIRFASNVGARGLLGGLPPRHARGLHQARRLDVFRRSRRRGTHR